ncbi:acyl-CoA dehydrogenase family protein [Actinoplanes sp. NPDC051513]|uniref:acyl-CoA dehydrogenase family protein n=1 Tax=Actinoplanes sp. NPDC051513 TaxID=3363908 RepID=UPI0037B312B2
MTTHEVFNQPPPLVDYDVSADAALLAGVAREGAPWAVGDLHRLGKLAGTAEPQRWADEANRYEPRLVTHDRYGHRVDEVEFHPSWHSLMSVAVGEGLAGAAWASEKPGAHVARAAGLFLWSQVEAGHSCPISMTYAVIPALRANPDLSLLYEPLLTSTEYDPGLRTPATKKGLLAGMGMTEKQGGSDVRANTTTAVAQSDGTYRLTGHKWFTSAPMCDLFLVLAQTKSGLSCFMVPRVLPNGERNIFRIQRLKDKLGNRSNASSEPEFENTTAWLVGDEGRGVRTIIEMVAMTRLDCVTGSASGMRAALNQAIHHARHRKAFGKLLADQPAMRNVLADLAIESEAATVLAMRLAGAVDRDEQAVKRLAIAVGKFWVCKRQPVVVGEALECLGGNGYVEDSGLPRLYRDAPLNSIWEGSGNVQALDVLRTLGREPDSLDALLAEVTGADGRIDDAVKKLANEKPDEGQARRIVERMAVLLQASLLVRHAPAEVSDAFLATRLAGDWGHTFGTLPAGVDTAAILERAAPA